MKVLIIEDDAEIQDLVAMYFELSWPDATVVKAHAGIAGLEAFELEGADIVILDLGLPDIDGLDVCRRIRESSSAPIVILTARGRSDEVVEGLDAGADDYVTKPFVQSELLARAQAVLRRTQQGSLDPKGVFANGELIVDFLRREVRLKGEPLRLTPAEYELLYLLASNAGKCITSRTLLTKVWGVEYGEARDYLEVQVQHLRRKLHDNPQDPRYIAKEEDIGYKFIG